MILVAIITILMVAVLISWLLSKWNPGIAKWIALVAMIVDFFIVCNLWAQYGIGKITGTGSSTWFIDYNKKWIPDFGIRFHLALDGLSLVLLMLTFFLGILSVLCSWKEISERVGFYYFNLLWTIAGISGVFLAMDLFLFYSFWEVMLIPMFFLIGIWGGEKRRYASYKFFIFTQAGGLLMLLSILSLYIIHGQQTGHYSYDYFNLAETRLEATTAKWIMMGFLVAFAVKLPMVPFHNWLPDAHGEAPTAGSLILAGLLLKTGAYGILRFVLPLFPSASAEIAWWAILFGVIGIIYGAMLAFAQTDLKRLIAYTSVSHMGFIMVGIFSFREIAMQGVVMQMLTHGISTGALFVLAGMIKERLHTRDIDQMGGLWTSMPAMGGAALVFTMASLGLPALGNFIAEFLTLLGAFPAAPKLTILATLGLVFSALYSLRMFQKVFLGNRHSNTKTMDMSPREILIMASLTIAIVLLGLYPQPVINMVKTVANDLAVSHGV